MIYNYFNPNPQSKMVGDCVVRAICKAFDKPWNRIYSELCMQGILMSDMPNSNAVWGQYLEEQGWERFPIANTCPLCYTFSDFAKDNPEGTYILGTGTHVATVVDGELFDSWDSTHEVPLMAWRERK